MQAFLKFHMSRLKRKEKNVKDYHEVFPILAGEFIHLATVVRNLKLRICQHFFSNEGRVHLRHASCMSCITAVHLSDSIFSAQAFFPLYSSNGVLSLNSIKIPWI